MPKTLKLIKATFGQMWAMRRSLAPIILIVMLPVLILGLITSNDQVLGNYGSLATLVMNIAVVWAVIRLKQGDKKITLRQAYYDGTVRFVAFVGVLGVLALQLIPFLIGGLVYVSGSTGATIGLSTAEKVLLGGVWALIALPSIYWLTRSVFGLYLVMDKAVAPVAAIRASGRLVKGKFWSVLGRFVAAAVVLVAIILIPSILLSTLPDSASWAARIGTSLLQLLSSLILVPYASIYGYNVLEALGGKPKAS